MTPIVSEPDPHQESPPPADFEATYNTSAGGNQVFFVNMDEISENSFTYILELPEAPNDLAVYLISTNTSATNLTYPEIQLETPALSAAPNAQFRGSHTYPTDTQFTHNRNAITVFNNNPPPLLPKTTIKNSSIPAPNQSSATVGDTFIFKDYESWGSYDIPATARNVVVDNAVPTSATIWVADDSWADGSCEKSYCITQSMVDAVASNFLKTGAENDIYDWVKSVFGNPWGEHTFDNLIDPSTNDIHILLFDISADNSTSGGIIGFFWAKDNYLQDPSDTYIATSNERLMFYLDSVLLSTPDLDGSWAIDDFWPSAIIGTLAHEFQHMIHFYEKSVTDDAISETWLNEMCSEIAEDIVANKVNIYGPRGVSYNDGSAGSSGNTRGRLPLYNLFNYIQVTSWNSYLSNYSINYALGAYLSRTYGPSLFTDIVQNGDSGTSAIETAIGNNTTFGEVLYNWAIANVLSDDLNTQSLYRYNSGDWISEIVSDITYNLGSINLFNYQYGSQEGPYFHNVDELDGISQQPPHSNLYAYLGRYSGRIEGQISYTDGTQIILIAKDQ